MAKPNRKELEILDDTPKSMEDRRVFSRFTLNDIPVRFKDLKIGDKGTAVCKDMSGGGLGIEVSREIMPRIPLEMWVDLPDSFEPMHFLGKVAWSAVAGEMYKIGISFDKPRLMSLNRILKEVK